MLKRFKLVAPKIVHLKRLIKPKPLIMFRKAIKISRILLACPQKKIIIKRIRITTPRKPNSARRKTVKGYYKFGKIVQAYIPGGKHQLKQYNQILVHGNGARDLPGIYANGVRGAIDLKGASFRKRRRSLFGIKKPIIDSTTPNQEEK